MEFTITSCNRGASNEEVIEDLKLVAKELNVSTLSIHEYRKTGKYSAKMFLTRFTTWNNALEIAGLEHTRYRNIPVADLVENLWRLWVTLGRQPLYKDLQKPESVYKGMTYKRMFGKWSTALRTVVAVVNKHQNKGDMVALIHQFDYSSFKPIPKHNTRREVPVRLRHLILKRDNYRCRACGNSPAHDPGVVLQVDHIIAWVNGGETEPGNLQTLCATCNIGKSDK